MDEPLDMAMIRNGIGPEQEQTTIGSVNAHRLWAKGWRNRFVGLGLRNEDLISSDRFEFSHAASVELENNRNAYGCAKCMRGDCQGAAHSSNEPTYNKITWTRITYNNVDHTK